MPKRNHSGIFQKYSTKTTLKTKFLHSLGSSFAQDFIVLQKERNNKVRNEIKKNFKKNQIFMNKKVWKIKSITLPYLPVGSTSTNSESSCSRCVRPFILLKQISLLFPHNYFFFFFQLQEIITIIFPFFYKTQKRSFQR